MRLKSLYIKGFKSFGKETTLHFNEDVIGVVGPNGSGKSNVVDAIRWVLGEQKSKELRLESMSDIIFNGTKTKRQAQSATVELTFENDDNVISSEYHTVCISRTLYRSGESEYKLNNVVCRLKDIKTLFMDTGIGSNSYAIIALGMVDDILADKDDARRKMFEQASGITKYKQRKKETIRKLNATKADLDRVEDLLFEVAGNMKSLEKQARKAKKYYEIKDEYKDLSIQLAVNAVKGLKDKFNTQQKGIELKEDEYRTAQVKIAEKEASIEKLKKDYLGKEESLSQQQKELNQLVSDLRSKENEKSLLEQKISFKRQNIVGIKNDEAKNKLQLENLNEEVVSTVQKVKDEENKIDSLKEALDHAKVELDKIRSNQQSAKEQSNEVVRKINDLNRQIFEIDKEIAIRTNQIENADNEVQRANTLLTEGKQTKEKLQQELEVAEKSVKNKEQELQELVKQEESRAQKLEKLSSLKEELRKKVTDINRKVDSYQNEYDLLKSMIENYEGFPESAKFLAQKWDKNIPILSDLLDVQDGYQGVIEQYLEPYLNYYVVRDIQQASVAIKLLTGSQKGKAKFFLLNRLTKAKKPDAIGNLVNGTDIVEVDDKYQDLLYHLLSDTYIYDGEIDDLLIKEEFEGLKVLAKNGTFFKAKEMISGGSVGLFEGKKIGRKKNLEKLEKKVAKLVKERDDFESKLTTAEQEFQKIRQEDHQSLIRRMNNEINQLQQNATRISVKLDGSKQQRANYKEQIRLAEVKKETANKVIQESSTKKDQLLQEMTDIKNNQMSEDKLDLLNSKLNKASEVYNTSNIEFLKQQNLVSNLQKDLVYKESRLSEIQRLIDNTENRLNTERNELITAESNLVLTEKQLVKLYEEKAKNQTIIGAAEQAFMKSRNLITELEDTVKVLNRASNNLQVEINTLKTTLQETRFEISANAQKLRIEFDIDINDFMNRTVDETLDYEQIEIKADKLKNRLSNYGEINPMAMEAYDEIKERFEKVTEERDDINKAQESLMQTIKEIEASATERFLSAFEEVRVNFIEVFRSLFTEDDNCDLILLDPTNPLESNIDIVAKPKGKKPKSLSQLSGGEKTLTATALLFALYLLKPAPFCIFDEVDAPLDDANIQKFNRIIKKFSKDSQFIIVTHNKSTMSAVGILYGVYMQEPGISNVTPVDFRTLDDDQNLKALN